MTDTINGRTPEEIKRGLECCKPVWVDNHWKTCDTKCPYIDDVGGFCRAQLMADTLALIQQLERERDAAVDETESLRAEIDAINEDYLSGIHTAREEAQPKWISVDDMEPAFNVDVLVYDEDGNTCIAQLFEDRNFWKPDIVDGYLARVDALYWMLLPKDPKEEM